MKTAKAFRSVENLPVASVEPAISGSRALSPDNSGDAECRGISALSEGPRVTRSAGSECPCWARFASQGGRARPGLFVSWAGLADTFTVLA